MSGRYFVGVESPEVSNIFKLFWVKRHPFFEDFDPEIYATFWKQLVSGLIKLSKKVDELFGNFSGNKFFLCLAIGSGDPMAPLGSRGSPTPSRHNLQPLGARAGPRPAGDGRQRYPFSRYRRRVFFGWKWVVASYVSSDQNPAWLEK